jgi:hypothetical protein
MNKNKIKSKDYKNKIMNCSSWSDKEWDSWLLKVKKSRSYKAMKKKCKGKKGK